MLYKINNSIVTIDPTPYLKPILTTTRTNSLSFLPYRCDTESFKHAYFPRTIPVWNTLPDTIVLRSSQCISRPPPPHRDQPGGLPQCYLGLFCLFNSLGCGGFLKFCPRLESRNFSILKILLTIQKTATK